MAIWSNVNVTRAKSKLGFNGTWSMAVGGMVGGGIFSTLGVVIGIAGAWAWLSFATAVLIALAAGSSYEQPQKLDLLIAQTPTLGDPTSIPAASRTPP